MSRYRHHRRNPEILGEDVEDLALLGLGAAVTSFVNNNVLSPIVSNATKVSGTMAKAVDVVTAVGSAFIAGEVTGLANRRVGRDIRRGGLVLAVAKGVSVAVPGYQVDARLPDWLTSRLKFGGAALPQASGAALPAGTTTNPATASQALTATGYDSMGF